MIVDGSMGQLPSHLGLTSRDGSADDQGAQEVSATGYIQKMQHDALLRTPGGSSARGRAVGPSSAVALQLFKLQRQHTLGFRSCCVRVGRGLYAGGFLHSYVQWPACRHRWQTVDADAFAGPRACAKHRTDREMQGALRGRMRRRGRGASNSSTAARTGQEGIVGVTLHMAARTREASKRISQRAISVLPGGLTRACRPSTCTLPLPSRDMLPRVDCAKCRDRRQAPARLGQLYKQTPLDNRRPCLKACTDMGGPSIAFCEQSDAAESVISKYPSHPGPRQLALGGYCAACPRRHQTRGLSLGRLSVSLRPSVFFGIVAVNRRGRRRFPPGPLLAVLCGDPRLLQRVPHDHLALGAAGGQ